MVKKTNPSDLSGREVDAAIDYGFGVTDTDPLRTLMESHRQMSNRISELERLLQVQGDINGKVLDYLGRQDQPKSSIIIPHNRELN